MCTTILSPRLPFHARGVAPSDGSLGLEMAVQISPGGADELSALARSADGARDGAHAVLPSKISAIPAEHLHTVFPQQAAGGDVQV